MAKEMPKGANGTIFKIKVISWNAFSIGDVSRFTPYEGNGLCKNIKMPKKVSFEPMNECSKDFDKYLDPGVGIYDF